MRIYLSSSFTFVFTDKLRKKVHHENATKPQICYNLAKFECLTVTLFVYISQNERQTLISF